MSRFASPHRHRYEPKPRQLRKKMDSAFEYVIAAWLSLLKIETTPLPQLLSFYILQKKDVVLCFLEPYRKKQNEIEME
jgi:hypothetical protein